MLPFGWCVETGFGPVGLDHGCAVNGRWEDLENGIKATDEVGDATRTRALYDWSYPDSVDRLWLSPPALG